jgi:hypothetical protein
MVFTALDYWQQGLGPPALSDPPAPGTALFRYLVRRLIDSWHLPAGPLAYYARMAPWATALGSLGRGSAGGEPGVGGGGSAGRGSAGGAGRLGLARQWPAIKASLDAGWPCPLGLVRVRSANPLLLGLNHQVLAFDYALAGSAVRLRVYDPNQADNDDVVIGFDLDSGPTGPSEVLSLFCVQYAPKVPPFGHGAGDDVRSIVRRRA